MVPRRIERHCNTRRSQRWVVTAEVDIATGCNGNTRFLHKLPRAQGVVCVPTNRRKLGRDHDRTRCIFRLAVFGRTKTLWRRSGQPSPFVDLTFCSEIPGVHVQLIYLFSPIRHNSQLLAEWVTLLPQLLLQKINSTQYENAILLLEANGRKNNSILTLGRRLTLYAMTSI